MTTTIHVYLRVSTDNQDNASQERGLDAWLAMHDGCHYHKYRDVVSGALPWRNRALQKIINQAEPGDTILCSEISRLGRSVADVLDFLKTAQDRDITVVVQKSNLIVDGSIHAKITTTILALAAEIEREFLRARTAEGLARARAEGKTLGRPRGATSASKCERHAARIAELRAHRVPVAGIARIIDVDRHTLARYLKRDQQPTDQE